ncbi:MAG TPA: hypothetical protein VMS30_05225 [Phycisphaerales bacterium]|nr:hypothetical protein [Phycisphaerales bacterium]
MNAAIVQLSLCLVFAQPPAASPGLSNQQRRDLATAQDDGEFREQAFYALVEHVRGWPAPPHSPADSGEAIRLAADLNALVGQPEQYRGELCRITGELLQITALGPPYETVSEWFVREDRSGTPVMVYVVQPGAGRPERFAEHQHVQIDGRFYKRMRMQARDRQVRDYAAFVGAYPVALATPASRPTSTAPAIMPSRGLDLLAVLAGPMVLLVLVFAGLRLWIARRNRGVQDRHALQPRWMPTPSEVDEAAGLPDDPAEALAELRRRAQSN